MDAHRTLNDCKKAIAVVNKPVASWASGSFQSKPMGSSQAKLDVFARYQISALGFFLMMSEVTIHRSNG